MCPPSSLGYRFRELLEVEVAMLSELSDSDWPVGPSTRFLIRSTKTARLLLVASLGEVAEMALC